jgi:hypothetical protein
VTYIPNQPIRLPSWAQLPAVQKVLRRMTWDLETLFLTRWGRFVRFLRHPWYSLFHR